MGWDMVRNVGIPRRYYGITRAANLVTPFMDSGFLIRSIWESWNFFGPQVSLSVTDLSLPTPFGLAIRTFSVVGSFPYGFDVLPDSA